MSDIKLHQTDFINSTVLELKKNGFDVEFTGGKLIISPSVRGDKFVMRENSINVVNYHEEKTMSDRWIKPNLELIRQEFSM